MTDRINRFEQAANMLVAGKKVSVAVKELPQGNVQAWLAELRSYVIFGPPSIVGTQIFFCVLKQIPTEGRSIPKLK